MEYLVKKNLWWNALNWIQFCIYSEMFGKFTEDITINGPHT